MAQPGATVIERPRPTTKATRPLSVHRLMAELGNGPLPAEQSRLFEEILGCSDLLHTRFGRVVAGYDDVKRLIHRTDLRTLDREWVASASPWMMSNDAVMMVLRSMITIDGETHQRLRAQFAEALSPRALRARTGLADEEAERLAHELRQAIDTDGRADLVNFAKLLPLRIIAGILGFPPSSHRTLLSISNRMSSVFEYVRTPSGIAQAERAYRELRAVTTRLMQAGQLLPGILTDLADRAEENQEELLCNVSLLLIAGFETTAALIGNAVYAGTTVLGNPGLGHIADRVDDLIEETLRWDSPVRLIPRRLATPEPGHPPSPRDVVMLWLSGANRDHRVFDRPHEFLLDRPRRRPPLSFGVGVHVCLGRQLALLDTRATLNAFVTRLPRLRPAGAAERVPTFAFGGFRRLDVTA